MRQRGQVVQHLDVNQYGQYLIGTASAAVSRVGNSPTLYADTLVQRDETAGLIFRAGWGAAGLETYPLVVTKAGVTAASLAVTDTMTAKIYDRGGRGNDIRAYGTITGASLQGAAGTAVIGAGAVTSVTVTAPGHYVRAPRVTFSGGGGTGAAGTAVLSGDGVVSVTITNGGSGYVTVPTVTFQMVWYTAPAALTANTAAIQLAIGWAASGLSTREIWFPDNVIQCNQLNATNIPNGVKFRGSGANATRLVPGPSVDGQVWIDCTGGAGYGFYNIGMGDTANPSIPTVGVLFGNSNVSGNASNVHDSYEWRMSGSYSVANVYGSSLVSSNFTNSGWLNQYAGAASCVYLSAQNKASVSSPWTTVVLTGGISTVTFNGCEFHGEAASSSNYGLRLENAFAVRLNDCHLSSDSTATAQLRIDTDAVAGPNPGACSWITLNGCVLYTEAGTPPPNGIYISNAGTTGSVTSLVLENTAINCTSSSIKAEASLTINDLTIIGKSSFGIQTSLLSPVSGNVTVNYPRITDAAALAYNIGAAGVSTGGEIENVGTVTWAATTSTTKLNATTGASNIRLATGTAALPSLTHIGDPNTGLYFLGDDWIGITAGGAVVADFAIGVAHVASGVSVGTNPSTTGAYRLPNNTGVYERNAGNSADVPLIVMDASQVITIGAQSGTSTVQVNSTTGVGLSYAATTRLATKSTGVDVTGVLDATGAISATSVALGTTPATAGDVRVPNTGTIQFRNNANTGNIVALTKTTSDNIEVGNATLVSNTAIIAANQLSFKLGSTFKISIGNNIEFGTGAIATNATAGHVHIPSCAGTPTGDPSPTTGMIPMVYDSSAQKIWCRSGGTWRATAALT